MKLTPVATALRVAAERLGTSALVQVKGIAMEVAVSPIQLAYEVGLWVLRVNKLDPINANDGAGVLGELFLSFFKTKTDNAVLAEELALDFHKALRDEAGLTDVQVMNFFKSVQDAAGVSESHSFGLNKQFIEDQAVLDQAVFEFQKALQEASTVSDTSALALSKQKADSLATSDAVFQAFNKALAEPLDLLDQASFDLQRILVESLGVNSHEVMAFFKVLSDGFEVQDRARTEVGKPAFETASLADVHRFGIAKTLRDTVWVTDDLDGEASIVDEQTLAFVKARSDLFAVSDLIRIGLNTVRGFTNSVGAADSEQLSLSKHASENGTAADFLNRHPTKALNDIGALGDQGIAFDTSKLLSEFALPVDHMARAMVKPGIADAFGTTDSPILGAGLVKTESTLLTDSGSLRSQGYTNDFSYFAEDYVGVSITF